MDNMFFCQLWPPQHKTRTPGADSGGSVSQSKGLASYLGFEKILPQRTFRNGTGMRPVLS